MFPVGEVTDIALALVIVPPFDVSVTPVPDAVIGLSTTITPELAVLVRLYELPLNALCTFTVALESLNTAAPDVVTERLGVFSSIGIPD